MTVPGNRAPSRERVLAFMEDMESRDVKRLSRWMSESTVFWVPPREPVVGGRRVLALLRAIFATYKTFHWEVREIYAVAASRCVYLHETTGTLAKDGAPYTNQVVTLIDFDAEGRIAYLSDYFKCTATFAQPKEGAPPIRPEPLAR
ncbi:MAG: nuclear transport factor 2 family protein [Vicinamibacteria bacterium]|nr:nuclear transport factor 2 family protein [Vicinamibacteria bacterium]